MPLPDWLERASPTHLGVFLGKTASPRKSGLCVRHLCRSFDDVFTDPRGLAAMDAADAHLDGEVDAATLQLALAAAEEAAAEAEAAYLQVLTDRNTDGQRAAMVAATAARVASEVSARGYYPQVLTELRRAFLVQEGRGTCPRKRLFARAVRPVFWEHFGDPESPVALDPAWRTSDVLALADGIYAERAFDRLPILADALQEAGCDNADVLAHCRGPGPHARGCWVVDLILGKA